MTRRKNDFYPTPSWATKILCLEHQLDTAWHWTHIIEPCAGDGQIVEALEGFGLQVIGNDIDTSHGNAYGLDASDPESWKFFPESPVVISNPPFNLQTKIVPLAVKFAHNHHRKYGKDWMVAMMLRLSFFEPCHNRVQFLKSNPIKHFISLPRMSFTGDGKKDMVACGWFIWGSKPARPITIIQPEAYQVSLL